MRKTGICILALCIAMGTGACGMDGTITGNLQTTPQTETNAADYLIDEVGDLVTGPEKETEMDLIVPDDETEEGMTEGAHSMQQMASGETESVSQAGAETETELKKSYGPLEKPLEELIHSREGAGENWALAYEDLASGESYGYREDEALQSASVVKLFIMGAVYRYMCYPPEGEEVIPFGEEYSGQLRDTIVSMITVSDNSCANLLIERLGEGDFAKGAQRIKEFCQENGYTGTSIGRRFLESNPSGDNFTTAADTRKFLSDIYHGKLVNEEASGKMLDIVKGQTRKNKIPAGLPEGFTSGNKTGEIGEGYGLGCMENDSAIVFAPEGMGEGYILTVMSTNLGGRNSEAINIIVQTSSMVAQWYMQQHG